MKFMILFSVCLFSTFLFANDTYTCNVIASHSYEGNTVSVNVQGIFVEVNSNLRPTLFGREEEPGEYPVDGNYKTKSWSLRLRTEQDGGDTVLRLYLSSPLFNAAVGTATADPGSKYIGFNVSDIGAECMKL